MKKSKSKKHYLQQIANKTDNAELFMQHIRPDRHQNYPIHTCIVWNGMLRHGRPAMRDPYDPRKAVRPVTQLFQLLTKPHLRYADRWSNMCGNPRCINPSHHMNAYHVRSLQE